MLELSHKTKLEKAIFWLEKLLEDDENKESAYQEFFEKNPIVFTDPSMKF